MQQGLKGTKEDGLYTVKQNGEMNNKNANVLKKKMQTRQDYTIRKRKGIGSNSVNLLISNSRCSNLVQNECTCGKTKTEKTHFLCKVCCFETGVLISKTAEGMAQSCGKGPSDFFDYAGSLQKK